MKKTSIGFHFRPSQSVGRHPGRLFIRIIHARQSRQISRNYFVFPDEWDAENKKVILTPNNRDTARYDLLTLIDESMKNDLKRFQTIVSHLSACGDFTASEVVARFTDSLNRNTVWGYAETTATQLCEQRRERTARAYRSAVRSFMAFNAGKDVLLSQIDGQLMTEYEQYLIGKGLNLNTVSFYLRNLRALYFRAIGDKIIPRQTVNPFAGMHTGVYQTKRRALDRDQIQSLAALEESLLQQLEALDAPESARTKISALHVSSLYFLFCFHARGMSFVDLAHLRKEDVGAENITYCRRKTGGFLEVKITDPMRHILTRFAAQSEGSDYVFPVIDSRKAHVHRQYEAGLKRQNRSLKRLAEMAGIRENLTTHAARHTWATLAKRMHVPVSVIGEALGHRDVKTTSIYLASFDRATMDELSVRLSELLYAA